MPDITAPNSQLELLPNATRSPILGTDTSGRHTSTIVNDGTTTKHLLTKALITTKGWTFTELVKKAPNFRPVDRVHFEDPTLTQTIRMHEDSGNPLIIEGFHEHESWPADLFTLDWLREHGKQGASVRNVHNWADFDLPLSELIHKLRATPRYASEHETERLYGKDAECPHEWASWLSTSGVLPSDLLPHRTNDYLKYLPNDVQTLMCYLGVGDTFTPFHKDLCASSGQNLMCYTENGGSSFWFMTESSAAPGMAEFFHKINEELDFETHVVTLRELGQSRLNIYIAEQQLGDLVLVPPRSCHQVINNGGITMKTSWSRMTLRGLTNSLYHELPVYHRVCRPETYKVKLNIYRALHRQTQRLQELREQQTGSPHPDRSSSTINSSLEGVAHELHHLLELLDDVLGEEYSPKHQDMPHVSQSDTSLQNNITCDFCGADIFQSFFECISCAPHSLVVHEEMRIGDGIVVCPLCYVEGRGCNCGTMNPTQCRPFGDLLRSRDEALRTIRAVCPDIVKDFQSLLKHPSSIIAIRHVGVFRAACMLHERRPMSSVIAEPFGMCVTKHQAPRSSMIYCATCHGGRCTTHVLESYHIHSASAILMSDGPEGGMSNWHAYHKQSKVAFKDAHARILHDEETGIRPDLRMKLAYVASKFRTCKSVNPNATIPGWYDKCVELTSASVASSPLKQAISKSRSQGPQRGGATTSSSVGTPALSTASLFRRSESLSDLTSLPSDFQTSSPSNCVASVLNTYRSLPTTRQHPGVAPANGKRRRFVMDCVFIPHDRPALSNGPSSSVSDDTPAIHIRSMPDKDGTSLSISRVDGDQEHEQFGDSAGGSNGRPPKKQRIAPPSDKLSRTGRPSVRFEKRASNGKVYMTNKPHSPVKLLPDPHDPAKKAVEIQATPYSGLIDASGDVGSVAQKQLDLLMAENDKLRTTNNELEKDKEIMENQLYDFGKRNEDLMTVNQYLRAQYSKARDNLYALRQEFVNPSSASAPPVGRHQEAMHRQDPLTYTVSYAGAPPTEPRFPARLMDYPPVQDMPLLELEKGGPRKNTRQQPRAPSDEENYSPVMPVAKPTQAQGQLGASVDEGNLSSPLGTEISLTISDGMEY